MTELQSTAKQIKEVDINKQISECSGDVYHSSNERL